MAHKLLLADDSVTIQRVIELTFADEDIQVIAVGDGKQAIDRVQTDRPDIVLADVGMPERDGYEVASFIKGNPQLAHIPVLLLTGAFEPIDEARARSAGSDGVLVKPFEPQMVINRVKDLLAGRRPAAPATAAAEPIPVRQQAAPQPSAATPAETPAIEPAAAPAESLDDYFDRLDAAFATLGSAEQPAGKADMPAPGKAEVPKPTASTGPARAAQPGGPAGDQFAHWDPELTGDPARPAAAAPSVSPRQGASPSPSAQPAINSAQRPEQQTGGFPSDAASPPAADAAGPVSLAEAFAALLAAEQGQFIAPSTAAPLSDDMVEDIVRRVIDRMTDQAVHRTVLDVAERMVREEIERIKSRA